jgi:hypothetical protein
LLAALKDLYQFFLVALCGNFLGSSPLAKSHRVNKIALFDKTGHEFLHELLIFELQQFCFEFFVISLPGAV